MIQNRKKNTIPTNARYIYGYTSAVELIGMLTVLIFLIVFANNYLKEQSNTRFNNQLIDQSKSFSSEAIKYIEDNYRSLSQVSLTKTDIVLSYATISGYGVEGVSAQSNNLQTPCLYITNGGANLIKAYIVFGATNSKIKKLDRKTIGEIAHGLGGSAGDLVNNNGIYLLTGYSENNQIFSQSTIDNIIGQCGFVSPLPSDSLIIDISKNISLFAPIKGDIDTQSTFNDADPSLKKNAGDLVLNTMQTNIYLDNIVKESTLHTEYYCDAGQLPLADAQSTCQNTANQENLTIDVGSAQWVNSIMSNDGNCVATAEAHFYSTTDSYSCSGVNFPDASSYCPQTYNDLPQVSGSGSWSPLPGSLSGSICVSTPTVSYQGCETVWCDGSSSYPCYYPDGTNTGLYTGRPCGPGSVPGVYTNNMCLYTANCNGTITPWWSTYGIIKHSCTQGTVPAAQSTQTNDLGTKNC